MKTNKGYNVVRKINLQKGKKERTFIELYQYGVTQNTIRRYW